MVRQEACLGYHGKEPIGGQRGTHIAAGVLRAAGLWVSGPLPPGQSKLPGLPAALRAAA